MKASKLTVGVIFIAAIVLLSACGKPKSKYEQVEMPTELMDYFAYAKEGSYWIMEDETGNYDSLWVEGYSRLYEYGVKGEEKKYWVYYTTIKSLLKFPTMTVEQTYYQRLRRDDDQSKIEVTVNNNSSLAKLEFDGAGNLLVADSLIKYVLLDSLTLLGSNYYKPIRVYVNFSISGTGNDRFYTFVKGIGCIERSLNPGGAYHFKLKRYHIVH